MFSFFKKRRRKILIKRPFPQEWKDLLKNNFPMYIYLPLSKQIELENHIKVLLSEKKFVGAQDLIVTDKMRLLICAQAAILLLGRKSDYFSHVETIVIYPNTFISHLAKYAGGGFHTEEPEARIGEFCSFTREIVFSWSHVLHGLTNPKDGHNVVLHEFAHQIDSKSGSVNGAPLLPSLSAYKEWSTTMTEEFKKLKKDIEKNHKTFIDDYGASSPAEFFAVLTEVFFEKPEILHKKHPRLYKILSDFYQQDPCENKKKPLQE